MTLDHSAPKLTITKSKEGENITYNQCTKRKKRKKGKEKKKKTKIKKKRKENRKNKKNKLERPNPVFRVHPSLFQSR